MTTATRTRGRQNLKPTTVVQTIRNQYDAGGNGRRMRGWNAPSSGPNRAVKGLQNIRNRADDSRRNDWTATSAIQKWGTTLIGIGIGARFPRLTDKVRRQEVADLFSDFANEADADGVLNLFGLQTMAVETWLGKGEIFVRERPRDLTLPLAVPVQFQMLEPEFVPLLDSDSWPGLPTGNRIRQGIELNRYDRRIAYWMFKEHPGDNFNGTASPHDLVRVAASQIWHVYKPDRPGQLRGVSMMASVLARLRSTVDFEDAVLDRQKLANLFVSFITRTLPEAAWNDLDINTETGLPTMYDNDGSPMQGLEPGTQQELRPGEDVKFANPPEAGTMFSEYLRSTLLGTSAGMGLPYEVLSGDIKNVSDRALRVMLNEFHRFAEQRQWQIIIPMFCQKAVDAFAKYAALAGAISLEEIDLVRRCTHAPHGWAYIHPVQDVQGKALEVQSGFTSRDDVIAAKGDDPEQVDANRAASRKREEAAGLLDPTPAQKAAQASKQAARGAVARHQQKYMEAQVRLANAQEHSLRNPQAQAAPTFNMAAPAAPVVNVAPAAVNVTNNVEPAAVNVTNDVNPTPVEITNDVNPTPVQIDNHVEGTTVNVTNDVNPTPVQIENNVPPAEITVALPDRKTTSEILRNEAGDIMKVTQIEKTVG